MQSEPALRLNPAIRDWNTIIAIRLLPLFETEPHGWAALTYLNRCFPNRINPWLASGQGGAPNARRSFDPS